MTGQSLHPVAVSQTASVAFDDRDAEIRNAADQGDFLESWRSQEGNPAGRHVGAVDKIV